MSVATGGAVEVVRTEPALREAIGRARRGGRRIALVPTMGALHEGHLRLVDRARERADFVVVSIFVNPLQFGPSEDLDRYPRTLDRDLALLEERGVHLAFCPDVEVMYPPGAGAVAVVPERGADTLCGASRPGHFRGVLTVVAKLFGLVAPDVAVFGRKDFQQAELIRAMVRDLNMPVVIDVAPVVRDGGGLALSSRNRYLSAGERETALAIPRSLEACARAFLAGERSVPRLRDIVHRGLERAGVRVEYVEIVDPGTLDAAEVAHVGSVCAVAGRVGSTRLIDNVVLGGMLDTDGGDVEPVG